MDELPPTDFGSANGRLWSFGRWFRLPRTETVKRLRWPLIILSSYLLFYTPNDWLSEPQVHAVLALYLLSHSTLFFLADELFDSDYFSGPLLLFDLLALAAVVSISGAAGANFYAACLLTLILSAICHDPRGLLAVTLLAPLVYGYWALSARPILPPNLNMHLPLPLLVSLFYGYYVQVERLLNNLRERLDEAAKQQMTALTTQRRREDLDMIQEWDLAVAAITDSEKVLEIFLEHGQKHLSCAAAIARWGGPHAQLLTRGISAQGLQKVDKVLCLLDGAAGDRAPFKVRNVSADARLAKLEFFKIEPFQSLISLSLFSNREAWGNLLFLTRDEHDFSEEEMVFLSALTARAAIAIQRVRVHERSQRQADESRCAEKVKDEFLKAIATDLRTPLNVIVGYTNMFLEGLLGSMTPIQERAIETVQRQSKDLQRSIATMQHVSELESDAPGLELHKFNLWELFSEVRSAYEDLPAKNVKLVWECPAELPTVQADRAKLKHILESLMNNAIKHTEEGSIVVSARYTGVEKFLELKVADNDIAVSQDELPTLLEGSGHRKPFAGGLDLLVARRCVELVGGTIGVESRSGEGSIFTVRIPVTSFRLPEADRQVPAMGASL